MTALTTRPEPSEHEWARCPGCSALHYGKRLLRTLGVCPECDHHNRLDAGQRIDSLVDIGSFQPLYESVNANDVLGFSDSLPYVDRLRAARRATGLQDAVLAGTARIGGREFGIAAMDFRFMGGSLGAAVGEMMTLTAEVCLHRAIPLVIVTASGGARMQEGAVALMQMAKVSQALVALREAGLLSVSVITDPTYGGVAASFATSCDVLVAEKGARMGFAGPRVIAQTLRQDLPPDFQTADFLMSHGHIDDVIHRQDLREWLLRLITAVSPPTAERSGRDRLGPAVITDPEQIEPVEPWDVVHRARRTERPTALDYIAQIFEGFVELHGDRSSSDCPAIVTGFARLDGRPVAVVGHQKGHDTRSLVARRFGMPNADGYRKALRVMRLAARLNLPVISLVDTPGAYPGQESEERGQSFAIADSIAAMFELQTPVVTIVTGEGGSGGALALAVADRILMFEQSIYSVISPEGCSAILWPDASSAPEAARALHLTARDLLELGIVDGVLPEARSDRPDGVELVATLHCALRRVLDTLCAQDPGQLVQRRRARFRQSGIAAVDIESPAQASAA